MSAIPAVGRRGYGQPIEVRDAALQKANRHRLELHSLRGQIRRGEVDLADLLEDPPAYLQRWTLLDVVRLGWHKPARHHSSATLEQLGREAVRDGVNLLISLERSSMDSRRWVSTHVRWQRWKAGGVVASSVTVGGSA